MNSLPSCVQATPFDLCHLSGQPKQLIGKQDDNAEHQVKGYLAVPLDHDIAGTEVFFQPTVRPFRTRSNLVTLCFVRCHGDNILASSISIGNRDMAKLPAGLCNQLGVVGGIHQIVEVGYFVTGHFDQRNSHLAVMQRG